jgi:hypothetical protein
MLNEEIETDCVACGHEESLSRILNTPIIKKSNSRNKKKQDTGNITKKFIEENREILKNQKKEVKNKKYDKT